MKKIITSIALSLALIVSCTLLAACGASSSPVVGKWEFDSVIYTSGESLATQVTKNDIERKHWSYDIKKDKTVVATLTINGTVSTESSYTGTWEYSNKELKLYKTGSSSYQAKLKYQDSSDTLTTVGLSMSVVGQTGFVEYSYKYTRATEG